MTFKSKRGMWPIVLIVVMDLVILLVIFSVLGRHAAVGAAVSMLIPLGILTGLLTWLFAATDYTVREDVLRIRSGPVRWTVPIGNIESIQPSNDWSSSPALSLDRLKIVYCESGVTREILVSPEDQDAFVRALRAVNPAIMSSRA